MCEINIPLCDAFLPSECQPIGVTMHLDVDLYISEAALQETVTFTYQECIKFSSGIRGIKRDVIWQIQSSLSFCCLVIEFLKKPLRKIGGKLRIHEKHTFTHFRV